MRMGNFFFFCGGEDFYKKDIFRDFVPFFTECVFAKMVRVKHKRRKHVPAKQGRPHGDVFRRASRGRKPRRTGRRLDGELSIAQSRGEARAAGGRSGKRRGGAALRKAEEAPSCARLRARSCTEFFPGSARGKHRPRPFLFPGKRKSLAPVGAQGSF